LSNSYTIHVILYEITSTYHPNHYYKAKWGPKGCLGCNSGYMKQAHSPLFLRASALIKSIPKGKILTYSQVANLIGARGCARQISYILSSSSHKYNLPWHRVLNAQGKISLAVDKGYLNQKKLLEKEQVKFHQEKVDLATYLWKPSERKMTSLLKGLPNHIPYKAR
jgi:methylated-DNA-protein-cysteine methyltransferase-like protein